MLLWSNKLQWSVECAQWINGGTDNLQGEVGQRHSIRIVFENEVLGFFNLNLSNSFIYYLLQILAK